MEKELNHKIIISPSYCKTELMKIKNENPFLDFKIIDKKTIISQLCFEYDEKAILYLYRQGIRFENTIEIIESMYFIKEGISDKVDNLLKWKQELFKLGFIYKNKIYEEYYKTKEFIIYGYEKTDKEINLLKKMFSLKIDSFEEHYKKDNNVVVFNNTEEEIRYAFEKIFYYYKKGIPLSKIKLVAVTEPYLSMLKKYQNFYSLKFNFPSEKCFFNTKEYQDFRDLIQNTLPLEAFNFAYDKSEDTVYLEKLLKKYLNVKDEIKDDELLPYLDFEAKKIALNQLRYENGIDVINLNQTKKDDIVILLGFALNNYPKIYKDNDFLSDMERNKLGLSTSFDFQDDETAQIKKKINCINNLHLSYSRKHQQEVFYPSPIIEEEGILIKTNYLFENYFYSKDHFYLWIGKLYDDQRNFSFSSPYLGSVDKDKLGYLTYSHQFKKINSYYPTKLKLSYSAIDTFFECSFKYYLSRILKVNSYQDTIYTKIGKFVHKLIEDVVNGIEKEFDDYLDNSYNPREKTLIRGEKDAILYAVNHFKEFKNHTKLKNMVSEYDNLKYKIDDDAEVMGIIDLIIHNNTSFAVIDHKTSDLVFKPKLIQFGKYLQLPIYYLLTRDENNIFNSLQPEGLYIFNTLDKDFYKEDYKYLRLNGITLREESFDIVQGDCKFIKPKRNKYIPYDQKEFEILLDQTKEKIQEAVNEIRMGNFDINPKKIDSEKSSCEDCPFLDICYRDYKDIKKLSSKVDEEENENEVF